MTDTYTGTHRNAKLQDIIEILEQQQDAKYDIVAPSSQLRYHNGNLIVEGGAVVLSERGVNTADASLRPTSQFEDGISTKLDIPRKYMDRMRESSTELLDWNVNHWLGKEDRNYFIRGFRGTDDPNEIGVARAFLSDKYQLVDHLDVLAAVLDGTHRSSVDVQVGKANLSDRAFYLEIVAPEVQALAPKFLDGYRSPFMPDGGAHGGPSEGPRVIQAGFLVRNSETGQGAYSLTPRLVVLICNNGMVINKEAIRKVHLGSAMDQGEVSWSEETRFHYIELIKGQTTDAIQYFLSQEYLDEKVNDIEEQASQPLTTNTQERVERVLTKLSYSETERQGIFDLFLTGGMATAGGLVQAVTAHAQGVNDPERAYEMEGQAYALLSQTI